MSMKTGIKVTDAMTENPITVPHDMNIVQSAEIMRDSHIGALLVTDKKLMHGICTEQDIVRKVVAEQKDPSSTKIGDIMDSNVHTTEPDKDIFDAMLVMKEYNIRHLPVVYNKRLVGLLTAKDILKIEPQLFDLLVEKFELREEERKPIHRIAASEGVCQICGEFSQDIKLIDGVMTCPGCQE